jgi:class 3 adenylate cyclase/tetratricopeptide (TPR) repeat protein
MSGKPNMAAVLVVDVVASTELRQRIGETRFAELRSAWSSTGRRLVHRHDGWLVTDGGDGFMAAFGTATAAVDAAVALLRVTAGANQRRPPDERADLRLGLSAGEVTWAGDDMSGLAAVEATRLQSAAAPNCILCTDLVRQLAHHRSEHRFTQPRQLNLKGLDEAVATWTVDWQPASTGQRLGLPEVFEAQPRLSFVGRHHELGRLQKVWDEARTGRGRLVAVSGEPGVGKTRLCAEMARRCRADGAIMLYGRCDEIVSYPYQPFVEALRHYVERGSQLELMDEEHVAELARLDPRIRSELGDLPWPAPADSDTQRYRLLEAVVAWLEFLSREDPVLLVLDDVTWATSPTLGMLHHLAGRLAGRRILTMITYRSQEASVELHDILAGAHRRLPVDTIALRGLSEQEVVSALQELLGGQTLDDGLSRVGSQVWRSSDGNPFFVGELFASLLERGSIEKGEQGWTAAADHPELGIPPAVGDVVLQRLRTLTPGAQSLLRTASMIGLSFPPVVARQAAGLDPYEAADALDEAESSGLIRSVDADAYEFSHALVRHVIDAQQGRQRGGEMHEAIARAIEERYADDVDEHAGVLSLHYSAAATSEGAARAVWYSAVAAQRASERFAHSEAVQYYRRALESLDRIPDQPATRARLVVSLGVAERRAGDPRSPATLLEGTRLAASLGDGPLCARAALAGSRGIFSSTGALDAARVESLRLALGLLDQADSAMRARLLANLSVELSFTGDHDEQDRLSDQATAMARRLGDPAALVPVLALRMVTLWRADRVHERLALGDELEHLCEGYGQPQATLMVATVGCQAAMEAGDFTAATRRLDTIDGIAAALRQPLALGYARLRQSVWAGIHGRLDDAERLADEAFEYTHMSLQPDAAAFHMGQRLSIRFHQGRLAEIIDELEATAAGYPGIVAFRTAGAMAAAELGRTDQARAGLTDIFGPGGTGLPDDLNWLVSMAFSAQASARLDDAASCASLAAQLAPYGRLFVDNASTFWGSVELYRAMALACAGDRTGAIDAFSAAAAAHARLDAPLLLAETRLEWAEALIRFGRPEDLGTAARLLGPALEVADRFGLRALGLRARDALSACPH